MSKFFARKFPNLEKEEFMQAGEVSIRSTLQCIVPYDRSDSREAWFFRVSQATGIRKTRVKSLFYNRQCRLWGDELARISGAFLPDNTQNQITEALAAHASARMQQAEIDTIKGEIKSEILEDIRALLLELRDSGSGFSVRNSGKGRASH